MAQVIDATDATQLDNASEQGILLSNVCRIRQGRCEANESLAQTVCLTNCSENPLWLPFNLEYYNVIPSTDEN